MNQKAILRMLSGCIVGVGAGCVAGGGGSGGGGGAVAQTTGGVAGEPCSTNLFDQGCNGAKRMQCDAASGKWILIDVCPTGSVCTEKGAAGASKRSATCETTANSDADAITAADVDTGDLPAVDGPITVKADIVSSDGSSGDGSSAGDAASTADVIGPTDVGKVCGNGTCESGETKVNCSQDCDEGGAVCNNGTCEEPAENNQNCPQDCPAKAVCGNGVCEPNESSSNCAKDCAKPTCGNGVCEPGETQSSCSKDCSGSVISDCSAKADYDFIKNTGYNAVFEQVVSQCVVGGSCLGKTGEQMATCIADCLTSKGTFSANCSKCIGSFSACTVNSCMSVCASTPSSAQCQSCAMAACGGVLAACNAPPVSSSPVCGNAKCEAGETTSSCSKDCPATAACGNGKCEAGETSSNCSKDCPATAVCGDFKCSGNETVANCPLDCDAGTQCISAKCPTQTQACITNSSCGNLFQCVHKCASGDQTCVQNCGTVAGSNAVQLYNALATCGESSGCAGTAAVCGNGKCESGETSTTCKQDCPVSSGHVCDTACGGQPTGKSCYCDATCKAQGDCCDASGATATGKTCAGSTCADCK
ncbi:MAG: hypothetical protein EXR77_06115 [Myxococcales bacterium]|nr:hypothetical protein [Myxococcales bacterium]